jgi:hydroxyacylglutathione hydrolase
MLTVVQFRYASDNLSYLVHGAVDALAIDGGAVDDMTAYAAKKNLVIRAVTNTHSHPDHTVGNQALLDQTGALFLEYGALIKKKTVPLESGTIRVLNTPGHTMDSVTFHFEDKIITGDTLFNGTVGNCFSGDLKAFYESINMLLALPEDTIVYAGHDYVKYAMAFAKLIEPDNKAINSFLKQYQYDNVLSTLRTERRVNPYLRFNEENIIRVLKQKRLSVDTEYQRWESIMALD